MNIAPRWRKLIGDFNTALKAASVLMVLALAIGLFALTTIASAYAVLTREISRNYLDTGPASALIDVGAVTPEILAAIAADPDIESAEPASIIEAQAQGANGTSGSARCCSSRPISNTRRSAEFFRRPGNSRRRDSSVVLEREALAFLDLQLGDKVSIELPGHERGCPARRRRRARSKPRAIMAGANGLRLSLARRRWPPSGEPRAGTGESRGSQRRFRPVAGR